MQIGKIAFVLLKTAIFTALVPLTVGLWLPERVHWAYAKPGYGIPGDPFTNILSLMCLVFGTAIYLWCALDFSVKGLGTPAPLDAPKNLVVNGLYRFVRNPMYLGVFCLIGSRAIFFWSLPIVFYLLFVAACFHLFIVFYEEPHLRGIFGSQYLEYSKRSPRWIPRLSKPE